MTKAHTYKIRGSRFFIDGTRVSQDRFEDSKGRSERIQHQFRYSNGTIGAVVVPEAKEIQREIIREVEAPPPKPQRWLIRGKGRRRSLRTRESDDLRDDHFVETTERIGNIDAQEEMLNAKYPAYIHFDTYIEGVET